MDVRRHASTVRNEGESMRARKATLTSEELFQIMGEAFKQTYSPRAPAELTCIVSVGYSSKLELGECEDSDSELTDLPIRGYLAAKLTSRELESVN